MSVPFDRVRERYHHDNAFHAAVDMLQGLVLDLHLTPSEIREAAMLACILIEERRAPLFFRDDPNIFKKGGPDW